MKVRMTKLSQSPDGKKVAGSVYDVSEAEAQALIDAEAAELVEVAASEPSSPLVSSVSGIGEARAEELAELGIETVADRMEADPEAIAEAISGVGVKTAEGWIEEAGT